MKAICKLLLGIGFSLVLTTVTGLFCISASAAYYQGDIIEFGEYPQTLVTDSNLTSALYYLEPDSSDTVTYEGERYKKVLFDKYTTSSSDDEDYLEEENYYLASYQDDNGYFTDTVYWFKYEPIQWRVLENSYGQLFVISEKILNAKGYRDKAYQWQILSGVTWANSTVRSWLNNEFFFNAFSSEERSKILLSNVVNNSDPFDGSGGCEATADYLYYLSWNEAMDDSYGFDTTYDEWNADRLAEGTDYAKCNGLYVTQDDYPWFPTYGKSPWDLRTTGEREGDMTGHGDMYFYSVAYGIDTFGRGSSGGLYLRSYGVRPAFKINSCVVTFDANGGTGGTSAAMFCRADLTAPEVTRPGYVFLGWDPEVPSTVPEFDTTYTAQWVKTDVRLTKLESGMKVNIQGWEENRYYQIWSYQKITSDYLLDGTADVPTEQWVLSQSYSPASSASQEDAENINFYIDDFASPDDNYTVAVRIIDGDGNFLREIRDSYTSEEVSEVKITKVLVDGEYSTGIETKEISYGSQIVFIVMSNAVPYTSYYARVVEGNETLEQTDENEFTWHTSSWSPGKYTVELTASNGETADTKNIQVQLYSLFDSTEYGEISSMALMSGEINAAPQAYEIIPDYENGTFWYRVSEPGRTPIFTSGLCWPGETIVYTFENPGIYQVAGFVNQQYEVRIGGFYDDGIIKTLTIPRVEDGYPANVTINSSVELPYVEKGTEITFTAQASIDGIEDTPVEYSFWRYDAKGYALIKDWSSSNTLEWTPARIGDYTIEARAKGSDAGSYEAAKSIKVEVYDDYEEKAQGVSISINEDDLNEFAQPRVPIAIKASATSTNSYDLLYKFNISDSFLGGRTVQNYSANPECVWTPRKAGTYTISVLVKNSASFGMYDAVESFVITVEEPGDPWDPGGGGIS